MDGHQHAVIEQARIAWHSHQFEHACHGHDCSEGRRLYRAYLRAISGDPAERVGNLGRLEAGSQQVTHEAMW